MQKNLIIGISIVAACVVVCASFSRVIGGAAVIPSREQLIEKVTLPVSRGNTLYVGGSGPGNYSRIQDAINASSDGDTVFVFQGSYYGKVVINKSISLLGENTNRTFINYTYEPDWHSYVVMICSQDIVFSGFTVVLEQGDGVLLELKNSRNCTISHNIFRANFGIHLDNSSYTSIGNNSFFTFGYGIQTTSSYGIIKHNWFTNNGPYQEYSGVWLTVTAKENVINDNYFYHCYAQAILSYSPYRNIIERNVIQQNISAGKEGIVIRLEYSDSFPPGSIIRENDIAGCGLGVELEGDYFTVQNNVIHDNDWGMQIHVFSCYHVIVSNNTFLNDNVGLDLENGMYGSVVERNVFHDCGAALDLYICQNVTVQHNNITKSGRAIYSWESKSNVISKNNFIGNDRNVLSLFSRDIWRGNYWNGPRFLPKLILGILPFIQFDWHPAKQPN
jgi:parallel beta-helix repeat protein